MPLSVDCEYHSVAHVKSKTESDDFSWNNRINLGYSGLACSVVREMVVVGVVWEVGYWLIKVPGRVLKFIQ